MDTFNQATTDSTPTSEHLLQTKAWGDVKRQFGWQPWQASSESCQAQVLFRHLPLGFSIAYIPKGPVGTDWQTLWPLVDQECRRRKAVFLQVEPDWMEPYDPDLASRWLPGFTRQERTIQPRRTILIDLTQDEAALLAGMKQKTRYNARLAEKKGVQVAPSSDLGGFYQMMQTTGSRDGFAVHSYEYYARAYALFAPTGECVLLQASLGEQPLAYLMLFLHGQRAWYFYGCSDDNSRNLMPTYLLQWEAMRWSKAHGAKEYDLWGIPDADEQTLEENFTSRSDGLWGVYRFKRGFGGQVSRCAPAFVKVYNPLLYKLYAWRQSRAGTEEGMHA
ncbi:MAG TPA: peptidoglycan bridge formation glycyltransferase FemA/FemB family protein [Anaerolineaceae bacterium]|nr:peptidoglycan bridge formation glycyltransferase FemA/FemB family protein [Anaerolineaceae bacterium]